MLSIEYINYLRIFYIIIDKIIINSDTKKILFIRIFKYNLLEDLYENIIIQPHLEIYFIEHIEYIENIFFY